MLFRSQFTLTLALFWPIFGHSLGFATESEVMTEMVRVATSAPLHPKQLQPSVQFRVNRVVFSDPSGQPPQSSDTSQTALSEQSGTASTDSPTTEPTVEPNRVESHILHQSFVDEVVFESTLGTLNSTKPEVASPSRPPLRDLIHNDFVNSPALPPELNHQFVASSWNEGTLSTSFDTADYVAWHPGQAAKTPSFSSQSKISPQNAHSALKVASAATLEIAKPQSTFRLPQIDLTPSYVKHLPHCEVAGVVVVQANFPLTEIQSILGEIRQLQHDLHIYMGIPAPQEKIELCLFKDEKSYMQFLSSVFPSAPHDRRALYVKIDDQPAVLLLQRTENFAIDLRHEMTHAIVHATIPNIPIWLDEGLAKYFEMPTEKRAAGSPYFKQIVWNVRIKSIPNMEKLEKLRDIDDMGDVEYRDSWAWTHFMIHHSPETHRMLAGYLQLLARLSTTNSASREWPLLSTYLKEALPEWRSTYIKHFKTMSASQNR